MYRACIVGYGAIGPVHAKALKNIKNVELYAICDIVKERADEGANKNGVKAYYDFEECIKDKYIDYVHICTPHYLHFDMITKSLDAGKRVVVEKPVVMKKEEFVTLLKRYDLTKIYPIFQNRTNTCIKKMKELISKNDYGKLNGIKGVLTWHRDENYYNSEFWRGTKKYEGGGVLINQAIHTLDIMSYFAKDAYSVSANMANYSLTGIIDVEDTVQAYIHYKNGAKGVIYATNAYVSNPSMQIEIEFEKADFIYINHTLFFNGQLVCKDSDKFSGKKYWGNGHENVLYDLYVNQSKFNLNDIKDTMFTLFAIYESANKRKEIVL